MEFNIMTWNVDWFRNGKRSEQEDKYCVNDCSYEAYGKIIGIVKQFLEKENAVVFLQEVPCKYKKDNCWYEHPLYAQLLKDFPKKDYDIFMNDNNGRSCCLRYTLAISKKGVYAVNNTTFCPYNNKTVQVPKNNRIISVKKDPIVLFGVHMPVLKNNKDDGKMWDDIIQYAKQVKNLIIAGDFNAYVGCISKETEKKYRSLLTSMQECVPADNKTFGNNRIDNILISKGTLSKNCKYYVNVQHNVGKYSDQKVQPDEEKYSDQKVQPDKEKYSDHKYVTMKLTIKD
ncbi:hypothetical protein [Ruminococcus sp.]|uniref:hypothetical protein n=1 Tax=Ruminococcus sp. TaxID=41978 RepID=UPI003FD73766